MSKLVDDPMDAYPFLPSLMPALAFAADAMSDPEARKVAENASKQLNRLSTECELALRGRKEVDYIVVVEAIQKNLGASFSATDTFAAVVVSHVAHLCCSLMFLRKFESADWAEIAIQLSNIVGATAAEKLTPGLMLQCKEMVKIIPVTDDDDDAEELCNCMFTLAYGTKILLHNTSMRLKRGAKYGLLGGNDSGKLTQMLILFLF
jgi:elongation factor 3